MMSLVVYHDVVHHEIQLVYTLRIVLFQLLPVDGYCSIVFGGRLHFDDVLVRETEVDGIEDIRGDEAGCCIRGDDDPVGHSRRNVDYVDYYRNTDLEEDIRRRNYCRGTRKRRNVNRMKECRVKLTVETVKMKTVYCVKLMAGSVNTMNVCCDLSKAGSAKNPNDCCETSTEEDNSHAKSAEAAMAHMDVVEIHDLEAEDPIQINPAVEEAVVSSTYSPH